MTWELVDGDRKRCTEHDPKGEHLFGPRGSCAQCGTSPAFAIVDNSAAEDEPKPAPEGCLSGEDHERKLVELAKFLEDSSKALLVDENGKRKKGRINYSTAFKGLELAIKAYSAAGEYTRRREQKQNVRRLERLKRATLGRRNNRGGSN